MKKKSPAAVPAGSAINRKIDALLKRMTLEEKIGQMSQYHLLSDETRGYIKSGRAGSLLNVRGAKDTNAAQRIAVEESRLKIPLIFGNDVIHGYATIFPIPLGEAASWDLPLIERAARIAATEARAAGTHWTFAPMVDIARDARWGRIAEGAGEDTHLGCEIAKARVRGFQGTNVAAADALVACAKHFVAYGAAEAGRDYNTVDISPRTLEEVYLPPFKAAIDAGVRTFMSAFNDLNGTPASGNHHTLTEILRDRWKFTGFVVSDWNSVWELAVHGVEPDAAGAGERAVNAGVDMDMYGDIYRKHLPASVKQGRVSRKTIDESVRRILRVKYELGLFEHPYVDPALEAKATLAPAHLDAAREAARTAMVLLKNDGGVLPLAQGAGSIAVVGPLADDRNAPLGTWACEGKPDRVVTVLEGLRAVAGDRIRHVIKGCEVEGGTTDAIADAAFAAAKADVIVAVVGETAEMSGEGGCRTDLGLPGHQEALLKALHATGKPVVMVLLNGRPMSLPWAAETLPAILVAWHPGTMAGHAVADVLFGRHNPSGRLPVSFPRRVGQVPIYYNHRSTGRPPLATDRTTSKYLDVPNTPQYPFGFGLSYTTFTYTKLTLSSSRLSRTGKISVSAVVKNTGTRFGSEVAQCYIRDVAASMTRPVRELKGFRRIQLEAGASTTVTFTLSAADLMFCDADLKWIAEPGAFKVWIGPNAAEGLEGSFTLS